MKKIIIAAMFLLILAPAAKSQYYKTGIGLRGGWFSGITFKHFVAENNAIEVLVSTRWRGFNITGLYEIHRNAFDVEGLNWFFGGGGHIGVWEGSRVRWTSKDDTYTVIGIDGIIGMEYTVKNIPISLSVDWKPAFNIIGHSGFWGDGGAFSIRYVF